MNSKALLSASGVGLAVLAFSLAGMAQPYPDTPGPDGVRKGGTLFETLPAPRIQDPVNVDTRRVRAYPEQPPTIPHTVRDYQIDLNSNQCMNCHTRIQTAVSGAPMISITHFMDRDFQVLAAVAPRRYFCMQCHVPQSAAPLAVGNTFKDVDILLRNRDDSGGEAP